MALANIAPKMVMSIRKKSDCIKVAMAFLRTMPDASPYRLWARRDSKPTTSPKTANRGNAINKIGAAICASNLPELVINKSAMLAKGQKRLHKKAIFRRCCI